MRSLKICMIALILVFGVAIADADQPRWIVVLSQQLDEVVAPLCDHRRTQGYDVVVLHIEDIEGDDPTEQAEALQKRLRDLSAESTGRDFVLLVGDMLRADEKDEDWPRVPPCAGTHGRMANLPTDYAFGCSEGPLPDVAVGRFPAGTAAELQVMVDKTLAFERQGVAADSGLRWRNRINMIVGHPGGTNHLERTMSEAFINNAIGEGFARIHPLWQLESLVHTPSSPFYLHQSQLRELTDRMFSDGPELFTIFLGHSHAVGFASTGGFFFNHDDWKTLPGTDAGILFSTGCFGSQIQGAHGEGYAQASLRSSGGSVAAIGATGLSYAAAGKWAIDGFFECVADDQPPQLLADYWMAALKGIATSPMPDEVFLALDQADGSRGTTSIDQQRLEHLEMWVLFGDPALRVPAESPALELNAEWNPDADGHVIEISSPLSDEWSDCEFVVIIERPLNSEATDLQRVRRRKELEQLDIILENWNKSNRFEIARKTATVTDEGIRLSIELPDEIPWDHLVIRALMQSGDKRQVGLAEITVPRD
ncbi:MAG: C25 family cysteine peptidase [Pirellulaceae bacterium]